MEMRWWLRSCNELPTYPVLGIKPERSSIVIGVIRSSEVDRNLLRVSRPRATTDPAISGSEQSKRDSRLTRSNSACGLDSVELELDFVFTSSSDSKQLDFGQGYLVGSRLEPDFEYPPLGREKISRELTFCERSAKSAAARCEQAIQSRANGVVEIVHVAVNILFVMK
ncbi:unnamed protein product [Microthlaspi erraticum]|uniref:Uncharacterized protein n=1 Tax=Microthlaspi erraticum TaxID=1685480 RepID=A0A6D2INT5_9BRAS|nr:unnamed protein product [Microthlaspi erraticum]